MSINRTRQYQVRAEGSEGLFYGGIIRANTKRSAIRLARAKFALENLLYGLDRNAANYAWTAEYVKIERSAGGTEA